ncbi:MAG TPA: class I SAM-dependent methyltransferase [Hyphomicrobiaceae bacterium]|nr:class I SAM-dependent methyltransferase [Hyphomicrobiaceae bacterium]
MHDASDLARLCAHPVFATEHYASGAGEKLKRSIALGPAYYFSGVPRYLSERRRKGIRGGDAEILWNPLHEFGLLGTAIRSLPPGLEGVLDDLAREGMRITLKPKRFLAICAEWWHATARGPSSVVECGSYEGVTGIALALLARRSGRDQQIHMFDVFGSLEPLKFRPVDGERQSNEFELSSDIPDRLRSVAGRLGIEACITLHVGLFGKTFPAFRDDPARPLRFAHIDANLYESTREAVGFVLPRLAEGAIVVFDDYHAITDLGARLAIDEMLGEEARALVRLSGTSAVLRRPG